MELDLATIEHIHFVGIGGISMSGLARFVLNDAAKEDREVFVSGSDRSDSELLAKLRAEGVVVHIGHVAENVSPVTELLVYSAAIPDDNPELVFARERGIPIMSRAVFLGAIARGYYTIAISGTHGKTTTTAMITKILHDAGLAPTALVGSIMAEHGSNFLAGTSKYLVVEACEYERQFLELEPDILVITNIEEDHLDYYKDLHDIEQAFRALALKVPEDGAIVCRALESVMDGVVRDVPARIIDYTVLGNESSVLAALQLRASGPHNIENAKAAMSAAMFAGVSLDRAMQSLNDFRGTARRFEYTGKTSAGVDVYDDYAHHPTAIKTTLKGVRQMFADRRIVVVFQPHLYSRTHDFLDAFAGSFADVDEVIIADIYPAREKPGEMLPDGTMVPTIHSRDLVAKIKSPNARYGGTLDAITEGLKTSLRNGDVLLTMGAGDVDKIGNMLLKVDKTM